MYEKQNFLIAEYHFLDPDYGTNESEGGEDEEQED